MALAGQRKYVSNVRSCAIQGIKNIDKKIFINGDQQTLRQAILASEGKDGKPIFRSVERTSTTDTNGRYLILHDVNQTDEAHDEIDGLLEYVVAKHPATLCMEGVDVIRMNQPWKDKEERELANALAHKYGSNNAISKPPGRRNAWNLRKGSMQPELVNNNDKFPHLQSAPATKKQRQTTSDTEHENDSNAEQQAATSAKTKTASRLLDKMNAIRAATLTEMQQFEKRLEAIETQQNNSSDSGVIGR